MKEYVIGFLFDRSSKNVLLIKKNRPEWQNGKLNGVGGHIEKGEKPIEAMIREFKEETGLLITNWKFIISTEGPEFKVYFYSSFGNLEESKSITDEQLQIIKVEYIYFMSDIIYDLKWIIPLSLIHHKFKNIKISNENKKDKNENLLLQ